MPPSSHSTTASADGHGADCRQPSDGLPLKLAAAVLAGVTLLAFSNSFRGAFVMDDIYEIALNPAMRRLVPPFEAMFVGHTLPARPLPYLTFAIDHAMWGGSPFGYHLTNLFIHLIAAFALFDLARTTFSSPLLCRRFGSHATGLALAIAAIWAVHPLQTQAVTYVYQRIESMMGMFCLVSLAAFARAAFDGWRPFWVGTSVVAAACAMASKESAVVLPLLILTYDWCFVGRSIRAILSRSPLYAAFAATWALVGLQVWLHRDAADDFFGMARHGPLEYAFTQPRVILHYVRLAFWPVGQLFDYAWPITRSPADASVPLAAVALLAILAAIGLWRQWPWGWVACGFFIVLSPTSSFLPLGNVAAEYRMYLPLAALVSLVVGVAWAILADALERRGDTAAESRRRLWPWAAGCVAGVVIAGLCLATQRRNEIYHDRENLWNEVLERAPHNPRGHVSAAFSALDRGDIDRALVHAESAIRSDPTSSAYDRLANSLLAGGDVKNAERVAREGLRLQAEVLPADAAPVLLARCNLAAMLAAHGQGEEAEGISAAIAEPLTRSLGDDHPASISCRSIPAEAAHRRGDLEAAEKLASSAAADGRRGLGDWHDTTQGAVVILAKVLRDSGRPDEANTELRRAFIAARAAAWWRSVDLTRLARALASLLEEQGRYGDAVGLRENVFASLVAKGAATDDICRAEIGLAIARAGAAIESSHYEEAESLARQAAAAAIEIAGPADTLAQTATVKRAEAIFLAQNREDAEKTLRHYLRQAQKAGLLVTGTTGQDFSQVELALAGLLEQVDRPDEALPIRRKVLRDFVSRFGPEALVTQREAARIKALIEGQDDAPESHDATDLPDEERPSAAPDTANAAGAE